MKSKVIILFLFSLILTLTADEIQWITNYDQALTMAEENGQNLLVQLSAPSWCGYCQWMDENTFSDPEIIGFINQGFIPVLITDEDAQINRFEFEGYPTTQVFSAEGALLKQAEGALDSDSFQSRFVSLARVSSGKSGDPIKLYGRNSSNRTQELKSYFESMGILYEFHDVSIPEERAYIKKAIEDFGWKGTIYLPVIVIGDLIYFPPN